MTSRREFLALCGLMTFVKHCKCSSLLPLLPKRKGRSMLSKVSTRSPHSPISLPQLTTHQDSPISTSERLCFPLHQPLLLGCRLSSLYFPAMCSCRIISFCPYPNAS